MKDDTMREDLMEFKRDLYARLDKQDASLLRVEIYQRDANSKTADLSKMVAVHEERLEAIKDSKGRLWSIVAMIVVTLISWGLHFWH